MKKIKYLFFLVASLFFIVTGYAIGVFSSSTLHESEMAIKYDLSSLVNIRFDYTLDKSIVSVDRGGVIVADVDVEYKPIPDKQSAFSFIKNSPVVFAHTGESGLLYAFLEGKVKKTDAYLLCDNKYLVVVRVKFDKNNGNLICTDKGGSELVTNINLVPGDDKMVYTMISQVFFQTLKK